MRETNGTKDVFFETRDVLIKKIFSEANFVL